VIVRTALPFLVVCLFTLTACQTAVEQVPMPPPPGGGETAPPEIPGATPPAPEPEPAPDYVLKVGDYQTSFAELEAGNIDKSETVTVVLDPSTEYARAVEILTRVSELGYHVAFQASP
jgi:hypothetical protein